MSLEKYYELLKKKYEKTNWEDLNSVREYNRYARELRQLLDSEEN